MLKRDKLQIIGKWYANAVTTIDNINRVIDYFEDELLVETNNVMFADCICSDDVNSIQFPIRAKEFLGPFKLGGLSGFPFAGLSGMAAYSSHVPENGAAFIYYGPHIGITKEGVLGEINRHGQLHSSACCGASFGALNNLKNQKIQPGVMQDLDYQINTIEQIILQENDRILTAKTPIFEATEVIYEAIDQRINELVEKTTFNCRYIVLNGGVMINSDTDMGSFTSNKRFDIIEVATGKRSSCLDFLNLV